MADRLKVAVVGLGKWGSNLLRALQRVGKANVTAICDSRLKAIAAASSIFQAPDDHLFTSFDDMLEKADVDAVVIATPSNTHCRMAEKALRAGKHVFVEKPMVLGSHQVGALKPLIGDQTFMVGHTFLYNDLVRWMKLYIDGGAIGKILYATGSWLNWGTVRTDVDAFWNFAPHPISILVHLFGFPPQDVYRTGTAHLQPGVDDVSLVLLKFGVSVVNLSLSWLSPVKIRQLFVVGEKASILFDDMAKELHVVDGDSTRRMYSTYGDFQLIRKAGQTLIPRVEYREPLLNQMEHFVQCCLTGEKPLTGFGHGAEVVRIMEQANGL